LTLIDSVGSCICQYIISPTEFFEYKMQLSLDKCMLEIIA
jgi:hypothetical protein